MPAKRYVSVELLVALGYAPFCLARKVKDRYPAVTKKERASYLIVLQGVARDTVIAVTAGVKDPLKG